jgi:death-on-curing family protein
MWFPSVEYIIELFRDQIENPVIINRTGLIGTLDKVRFGLPFNENVTIWERVTILYQEIVENHYFMDGNKRIGILIAFIFLNKNGYNFQPPLGEIFNFTMAVAQNQKDTKAIRNWFKKNSISKS